jgi:hypothetical protein
LLKFSMCCGGTVTKFNTKKVGIHFAARCSLLPFPLQVSQTCHNTSSTYSTLWYCKAMPLQVGMEEGPKSKSICVRGLRKRKYLLPDSRFHLWRASRGELQ